MLILKEIEPRTLPASNRSSRPRRRSWIFCQRCLAITVAQRLNQRFCSRACKTAAQATGRKAVRVTTPKARAAHGVIHNRIRSGLMARPTTCESCGTTGRRIEAAHYTYDEPLRVRWLCRSCHVRWDKQEPKGGTIRLDLTNEQTPAQAGAAGSV